MLIPIQDLEKHLDADVFEAGLLLVEGGGARDLEEVEKNLWTLEMGEGAEPEILVSRKRLKYYACDCAAAKEGGICAHVAALMILLRRRWAEREKVPKDKPKSKESKTINTANILGMAGHEELKQFVREYARGNRQFSVALKTHFIHLFEEMDLNEKYAAAIDTIIKSQLGRRSRLAAMPTKRLAKNLAVLLKQAKTALAKRHYADAFALLSNFVERVLPVTWKSHGSTLMDLVERAFDLLDGIPIADLPRGLQGNIRAWLMEECPKFKYRSGERSVRFFPLLEKTHRSMGSLPALARLIAVQIKDGSMGDILLREWQILYYRVVLETGDDVACRSLEKDAMKDGALFTFLIKDARDRHDKSTILALAGEAKRQEVAFLHKVAVIAKEFLLELAVAEEDRVGIRRYAAALYRDTQQKTYFNLLKEHSPKKEWKNIFNRLLENMREYSPRDKEVISELLAGEERWEALHDRLREWGELAPSIPHANGLLSWDRDKALVLYSELMGEHLRNHIGSQGAQVVRRVLLTLSAKGEGAKVAEWAATMRQDYKRRISLLVVLEGF